MALRVLLTGADWVGDVLGACKRAFEQLGAHVQVVATNETDAGAIDANALQARTRALPLIGRYWARQIQHRMYADSMAAVRRRLTETLRSEKPDLLLALVDGLYPVMADVMNDHPQVTKIAWMMDDPFYYRSASIFDLHTFDVLHTVDDSLVAPLRQATGRPVSCVPLAADTTTYKRLRDRANGGERYGLVFVGKSYRNSAAGVARRSLLSRVVDCRLSIWGDEGWQHSSGSGVGFRQCYRGGPTRPEETNRIYNCAEVVINILHPQIRHGTSLRTFSICAAGAFQVVEWRPGVNEMLEPDREIVTYQCGDELKEKARRYLNDACTRRRIAAAGHSRVIAEHTYIHRLRHILAAVDMGGSHTIVAPSQAHSPT